MTTRTYLPAGSIPVYPDTEVVTDPSDESLEPVTAPHPLAGQVDLEALQVSIGDAVWVGAGSKWALPWENGVVPITVTADHAPSPAPDDWADVACMCLASVIRYNTGIYPTAAEIRAELAGKVLVDSVPLNQPSHADVLIRIADGA